MKGIYKINLNLTYIFGVILLILSNIILSANLQAFPNESYNKNNRWLSLFYIDTTLNQEQFSASICNEGSSFYVSWIGKVDSIENHIYIKKISPDSFITDSLPIDITRRDSIMYYKVGNAYLSGHVFTVYSYPSPNSYMSGDENIEASIIDIYNNSITKIDIEYSYYYEYENPPYMEYERQEVGSPVVASDKYKFLVMYDYYYEESLAGGYYSAGPYIVGDFFNSNGGYLGEFIIPSSDIFNSKSLIFDGENYVLLLRYNNGQYLYITKIDTTGNIGERDSIGLYTKDMRLEVGTNAIASDSNRYLVVWSDYVNGNHCILGRMFSKNLVVADTLIVISQSQYVKTYPSVVFDENNFIVTWQEYKLDSYNIKGAVVSPLGFVIDSFVVDDNAGDQTNTRLSYGSGYTFLTYTSWSSHFGGNRVMGRFSYQTNNGIIYNNTINKGNTSKCLVKYTNNKKIILQFRLQKRSYIKFELYDITGRTVKKLNLGDESKGVQKIELDESKFKNGVYFYNIQYGDKGYYGKINILR